MAIGKRKAFSGAWQSTFSGVLMLLLGAGLLWKPFRLFGVLFSVLPWVILIAGAWRFIFGLLRPVPTAVRRRKLAKLWNLAPGILLLLLAGWLFHAPDLCDKVLWYLLTAWIACSAWQFLRQAFTATAERQTFWRIAGGGCALLLAVLMLWMPRSGLSDALRLLGCFLVCWGIFQLNLPGTRE